MSIIIRHAGAIITGSMCGKLLFANGGGLLIVAGQDIRLYVKIPAG
ncbi:hypothetical protein ACFLVL_03705 [Chloroflexota bacterium]